MNILWVDSGVQRERECRAAFHFDSLHFPNGWAIQLPLRTKKCNVSPSWHEGNVMQLHNRKQDLFPLPHVALAIWLSKQQTDREQTNRIQSSTDIDIRDMLLFLLFVCSRHEQESWGMSIELSLFLNFRITWPTLSHSRNCVVVGCRVAMTNSILQVFFLLCKRNESRTGHIISKLSEIS